MKANRKSAFGLLEVIIASVVLGFLIVALLYLQMGNREGILRVRARDAANFIAAHVLDSIASAGMKTVETNILDGCPEPSSRPSLARIYCNPNYEYYFEGKSHSDKTIEGGKVKVAYTVEVFIQASASDALTEMESDESTLFTKAKGGNLKNMYSQSLEAVVSWKFKNATMYISMDRRVK